jgi:uncharacterized protein YoxC
MPNLDNQSILLVFVAITSLAMLMQAIILLAIYLSMRKASTSIREQIDEIRSSVMPVVDSTRDLCARASDLFQKVSPKVESAASDLAEMAHGLRVQTNELQVSTLEVLERVRRQSGRIDHMFSGLLDAVDRAGGFVAEVVSKPVRQFSGILASIKAVIETLGKPTPGGRPTHTPVGKDTFV